MPPAKTAKKTKTMDLDRAIMVHGKTYGPGKGVEVPADTLSEAQLKERKAIATKRNGERTIGLSRITQSGAKPAMEELAEDDTTGADGGGEDEHTNQE